MSTPVPTLADIFTPDELDAMRAALAAHRGPANHREGAWQVSCLNSTAPADAPAVSLRDITLRTGEQLPNASMSPAGRLELLTALLDAGTHEFVLSAFRRGHTAESVRREVELIKSRRTDGLAIFGNAVSEDDLRFAQEAGLDGVEVWTAVYLGAAIPVSAGAVYHRVWQGREWRDLRFPGSVEQHAERARRLIDQAQRHDVAVTAVINLAAFADEEYVATFTRLVAEAGAREISIADSTGGLAPEGFGRLVSAARSVAPDLHIGVHPHNSVGLGVANAVAAVQAGAASVETAVNGYEVGPGGTQAPTAATAMALEAFYGRRTGLDLPRLMALSETAARVTGYPIAWNEPLVGISARQVALPDEYVMELDFDELIHASVTAEAVGAHRDLLVSVTTGPFGMARKLAALGVTATKEEALAVLDRCKDRLRAGEEVNDQDIVRFSDEVRAGASTDV